MDWDNRTRTGAKAPGAEWQTPLERRCSGAPRSPAQNGESDEASGEHEGRRQTARRDGQAPNGKAPSDIPALKPYWGKPAVRNFREDDGNVGIIRSPVRAIVLPDHRKGVATHPDPESCVASRKATTEALTGAQAGRVLSCEIIASRVPTSYHVAEGNIARSVSASSERTLRSLRPRACLETPRARTGRPH